MSLKDIYERFLRSPSTSGLADGASLHYVTTLTAHSQPVPIVRHLQHQSENVVKKKSERVVSAVEGQTSIALVVETTLEFVSSGGAYLPGLDNFILDRTATLPIAHVVHFDREDKITQVRISWDQGDLLKQVEVIGSRGKNWPVFSGKDQIRIITSSATTAAEANPEPPRGRNMEEDGLSRSASPSKKYIKDPHASLSLFEPSESHEHERRESIPNAVPPRESAKPAPREMSDLFAAGHEDHEPSGPGGLPRRPIDETVLSPKGAAGKRFQANRLFEGDSDFVNPKIYKTNPARYNHFNIGDDMGDDPMQHKTHAAENKDIPSRGKMGRAQSQWGFEDFMTPVKVAQKVRDQDVIHFSYADGETVDKKPADGPAVGVKPRKDAETHFEFQDNGTPVIRPAANAKPRPDAETHFDFRDEATPGPVRIIGRTKAAAGLYHDPVFGNEEEEGARPLATITNHARKNDFQNQRSPPDSKHNGTKPFETNKTSVRGTTNRNFQSSWSMGGDY